MKLKLPFFFLIGLGFIYCSFQHENPKESRQTVLLSQVLKTVQQKHFRDIPIDDKFSELMYHQFFKKLDPDKLFITLEDIEKLKSHQHSIDEELKNGTFQFFDQAIALIKEKINKAEAFCNSEITEDIDIYENEIITIKNVKSNYADNDTALKDYWRKKVKHNLVNQLYIAEKNDENFSLETQKEAILKKVAKHYEHKFNEYRSADHQKYFQYYLQAFLDLHDAQSTYMTQEEKDEWDLQAGRSLTGVGVNLNIINDYPQILKVTAGGPAWKSKKIKVGDVILKVSHSDGTLVDTWGMDIKTFLSYFKGEKGTAVTLHVQKITGNIEVVEIVRDEIKMDLAMSFILNSSVHNRRIGYIMLPRFYGGGEDAAFDVAQEIDMLKANKVDGIVFDVRSNRGGYSNMAIDIMGYFLKSGIVMQTQARDQNRRMLDDEDGYVRYEGDLVVLVDSYSASASELFAGTMQDYKRGIVVGSKATFGKGSMQRFYNLDTEVNGEQLTLGSLKLTTARFYTGCGYTPQTNGIIPDIQLPDDESFIVSGERRWDNSIPTEKTERSVCKQDVNVVDNLEELKEKSTARIEKNHSFRAAKEKAHAIAKLQRSNTIQLHYDRFKNSQNNRFKERSYDQRIFSSTSGFSVAVPPQDIEGRDSISINRDDRWIKKLERDPYVYECYLIMLDALNS